LQAWIAGKRVKAPAVLRAAGVRLWTEADLAQVLKVKPRNYPRKVKRNRRKKRTKPLGARTPDGF
jgi:hypothetical protein